MMSVYFCCMHSDDVGEEDTEVLEKLLSLTSRKKFVLDTGDLRYLVKELVPYSIYHLGVQWKRFGK